VSDYDETDSFGFTEDVASEAAAEEFSHEITMSFVEDGSVSGDFTSETTDDWSTDATTSWGDEPGQF
jgi:hypothetical protein